MRLWPLFKNRTRPEHNKCGFSPPRPCCSTLYLLHTIAPLLIEPASNSAARRNLKEMGIIPLLSPAHWWAQPGSTLLPRLVVLIARMRRWNTNHHDGSSTDGHFLDLSWLYPFSTLLKGTSAGLWRCSGHWALNRDPSAPQSSHLQTEFQPPQSSEHLEHKYQKKATVRARWSYLFHCFQSFFLTTWFIRWICVPSCQLLVSSFTLAYFLPSLMFLSGFLLPFCCLHMHLPTSSHWWSCSGSSEPLNAETNSIYLCELSQLDLFISAPRSHTALTCARFVLVFLLHPFFLSLLLISVLSFF